MSSLRRPWVAGRSVLGFGAAASIALGLTLAAGATGPSWPGSTAPAARAADPVSTAGPADSPPASAEPAGDPRVPSGGPGFIGEPALAVAVVLAIGVVTLLATLFYVRLTSRPGDG